MDQIADCYTVILYIGQGRSTQFLTGLIFHLQEFSLFNCFFLVNLHLLYTKNFNSQSLERIK